MNEVEEGSIYCSIAIKVEVKDRRIPDEKTYSLYVSDSIIALRGRWIASNIGPNPFSPYTDAIINFIAILASIKVDRVCKRDEVEGMIVDGNVVNVSLKERTQAILRIPVEGAKIILNNTKILRIIRRMYTVGDTVHSSDNDYDKSIDIR